MLVADGWRYLHKGATGSQWRNDQDEQLQSVADGHVESPPRWNEVVRLHHVMRIEHHDQVKTTRGGRPGVIARVIAGGIITDRHQVFSFGAHAPRQNSSRFKLPRRNAQLEQNLLAGALAILNKVCGVREWAGHVGPGWGGGTAAGEGEKRRQQHDIRHGHLATRYE